MKDTEIIDLYWQRIERAITETDKKYGNYCRSISYNILSDYRDVEECMDDSYLNTWNTIPPCRPKYLMAYVGRIVRNISINMFKKRTAAKRGGNTSTIISELDECVPDIKNGTEHLADSMVLTKCIDDFLHKQPQIKQDIFVRRYWYANTIPQISKYYCMSESKISTILFRMRKDLKIALEKEGISI